MREACVLGKGFVTGCDITPLHKIRIPDELEGSQKLTYRAIKHSHILGLLEGLLGLP
jgi:hypothetical protein